MMEQLYLAIRYSAVQNCSVTVMPTEITDYVNVATKAADLGCQYPERLALLPINFESAVSIAEFLQASEAATIKKLLVERGLPVDEIVDRSQRPPYVKNKAHQWVAPVLFISASLYSQNPELVSLALNVLGNYATQFFMSDSEEGEVSLDVVIEKKKNSTYKKISYKGSAAGLSGVAEVIRELADE